MNKCVFCSCDGPLLPLGDRYVCLDSVACDARHKSAMAIKTAKFLEDHGSNKSLVSLLNDLAEVITNLLERREHANQN